MIQHPLRKTAISVLTVALATTSCVPDASRQPRLDQAVLRIVAAEDARPTEGRELATLIDAAKSERMFLRRTAVRALGRLENPDLAPHIEAALADPSPTVRQVAANALAQAYRTTDGHGALAPLVARAAIEEDTEVRGTIARSAGRLTLSPADRREAAALLVGMSRVDGGDAPTATLLGVTLGLEALVRGARGEGLDAAAASRLEGLIRYQGRGGGDVVAQRIRSLAYLTLGQARRFGRMHVDWALGDPSVGAAPTALRFLGVVSPSLREDLVRRGVSSGSTPAVVETLRFITTQPRSPENCLYLMQAAAGPPPNIPIVLPGSVRIMAIDALADPCPNGSLQRSTLTTIVGQLDDPALPWQVSAHALVTLARTAPSAATAALPDFVGHSNPFVRTYAARAAADMGNRSVLRSLASDDVPNVRTAAVTGLATLDGRGADDVLVRQLTSNDAQLLMTAAGLLEGTNSSEAAPALLEAFRRLSDAGRETQRDARRALIERLAEVGEVGMTDVLEPYLTDFDAVVAEDVASLLQTWNGRPYVALPNPLPRALLPTAAELRAMDGAAVVLHMEGGGVVEITLHPYEATASTFRFVRLVGEGHFDGLTFHRWAPNFVLQGGSPGANEYEGDGAFARDEVGLRGHWRGTVGISTRGHDTGDGQIFVNLLDNVRLDHLYTIVGTVTAGMEVVDDALEGAVIERAELREARRPE